MRGNYERHSAAVLRSQRWKGVRYEAKKRDNWQCVQCSAKGRLEVDHIKAVKTNPELAYDLSNLQTLCVACHSRKTRIEVGMGEENPAREAWKTLVAELQPKTPKIRNKTHA